MNNQNTAVSILEVAYYTVRLSIGGCNQPESPDLFDPARTDNLISQEEFKQIYDEIKKVIKPIICKRTFFGVLLLLGFLLVIPGVAIPLETSLGMIGVIAFSVSGVLITIISTVIIVSLNRKIHFAADSILKKYSTVKYHSRGVNLKLIHQQGLDYIHISLQYVPPFQNPTGAAKPNHSALTNYSQEASQSGEVQQPLLQENE